MPLVDRVGQIVFYQGLFQSFILSCFIFIDLIFCVLSFFISIGWLDNSGDGLPVVGMKIEEA